MCSKQTLKSTVWVKPGDGEQLAETGDSTDRSHGRVAVGPIEQEGYDAGVFSRLKVVHKTVAGENRSVRRYAERF
jgi:hypothetical protein